VIERFVSVDAQDTSSLKGWAMRVLNKTKSQSLKDLGRLCCESPASAERCRKAVKNLNQTLLDALEELERDLQSGLTSR